MAEDAWVDAFVALVVLSPFVMIAVWMLRRSSRRDIARQLGHTAFGRSDAMAWWLAARRRFVVIALLLVSAGLVLWLGMRAASGW